MPERKKITLLPFGGLGNRMRVLNSAFYLNGSLNYDLAILWFKKWELNSDLTTLFSSLGYRYRLLGELPTAISKPFLKHIFIQKYPSFYKSLLSLFFDKVYFDEDLLKTKDEELKEEISRYSNVLIATCYPFYPFANFNNFELHPELQARVDELARSFDENVYGVHIRRTDHTELIQSSPLEAFIEAMEKLVSKNPASRFFLATDDLQVKQQMKDQFKNRIITQEIELSRNSDTGMIGAVTDIYCLARTRKIICSTKSSFATTAALIGQQKEIIEVGR
jgi:hypothetical protein